MAITDSHWLSTKKVILQAVFAQKKKLAITFLVKYIFFLKKNLAISQMSHAIIKNFLTKLPDFGIKRRYLIMLEILTQFFDISSKIGGVLWHNAVLCHNTPPPQGKKTPPQF